jgi:Zn-dependent protease
MASGSGDQFVLQPHVHVGSQDASPQRNSEEEKFYQRACAALADQDTPSQKRGRALLLLLSTMVVFAAALLWAFGFSALGLKLALLLIGVLLLHEAGHYLGMRLFGYRDLRMFFIPFFGAAVSGRKHAAPAWQQAIMLLLGPLPGIALAVLLCVIVTPVSDWLRDDWSAIAALAALGLLLINGVNLLPLVPLDGGRLLRLLIFDRHPFLESGFLLFSAFGLAVVGWILGWWVLGVLAVAVLIGVPFQYRKRRRIEALRREVPDMPGNLNDLTDVHRRTLFRFARPGALDDATECATEMKTLHEKAVTYRPTIIPTIGLLSLYVAAIIAVGYSWILLTSGEHPGNWRRERIEAKLAQTLKLEGVSLRKMSSGKYSGTGQTVEGTTFTLEVIQDTKAKELRYTAVNDNGQHKRGRIYQDEVTIDGNTQPITVHEFKK